jgi:hypothetical protein
MLHVVVGEWIVHLSNKGTSCVKKKYGKLRSTETAYMQSCANDSITIDWDINEE